MKKMKVFMMAVIMMLALHSEMSFASNFMELPEVRDTQVESRMINLSKDRIVIKRRKYKGRSQYRRYNATKKKQIDSRWKNQSRRYNAGKRKRTKAKRTN